jgi:hypothetical protein
VTEAWQFWDFGTTANVNTSSQVNNAAKSDQLKLQQSLMTQATQNSWAAQFETIQPGVQAQMQGDMSQSPSWFNTLVGGFTTSKETAQNSGAVNSADLIDNTAKAVKEGVSSATGFDWNTLTGFANETLVRVALAALALMVIFLALRKMV